MERRERIMQDYCDAYLAANGRPVRIDYFRGWYSVFLSAIQMKYREREIIRMTEALRARVDA